MARSAGSASPPRTPFTRRYWAAPAPSAEAAAGQVGSARSRSQRASMYWSVSGS